MQEKSVQHYRVTLDQAKRDYQDGLLTATGLVYYAIAILRPPRQKLRIRQKFPEELGIAKRTFYRALSKLKLQNQIEWEPTETLNVWTTPGEEVVSISDFQEQKSTLTPVSESLVGLRHIDPLQGQIDPLQGQIDPLQGQIDPLQGQIDPLQGQIDPLQGQIDPNRSLEPLLGKGSKNPHIYTDITDIYISLSNEERENFEIFSREIVNKLPSKPVLPDKWIEANFREIWKQYKNTSTEVKTEIKQKAEIKRKAIAIPTIEQMAKLQEFEDAGKIKGFYPNSQNGDGTIIVDTGSGIVFWWEFLEVKL